MKFRPKGTLHSSGEYEIMNFINQPNVPMTMKINYDCLIGLAFTTANVESYEGTWLTEGKLWSQDEKE